VGNAVDGRLHAAGPAGFEGLARVVEPHVAAMDEVVRDMEVVIVNERDSAAERRVGRAAVHVLEVVLAAFVGRMRLAREHDLHRPA